MSRLVMDSTDSVDAYKSGPKSTEHEEESPISNQAGNSKPSLSERTPNSFGSISPSEEMHKP